MAKYELVEIVVACDNFPPEIFFENHTPETIRIHLFGSPVDPRGSTSCSLLKQGEKH